jgi:RND family efflux transporter MFP subunit
MKHIATFAAVGAALALASCNSETNSNTKAAPPARPVLSIVVKPNSDKTIGFAGTIQPQYQTELGFRVLGRLIARNVNVGDLVKTGQSLAQLDPFILALALRTAEADLVKARAQLSNTTAAESRISILLGRQVSNQADFDSAQQAKEAAAAAVQQAEANLAKAREQLGYTTLSADIDGVVTTTDAEVGQMVAAGKRVVSLARTDIREAVVDIPDDRAQLLAAGAPFEVHLQADPLVKANGKVREIAPQADAATRTRRIKITLEQASEAFRLGATVTATPLEATTSTIDVPLSALLERDGATRVWIVDTAAKTVKTVPVQVAERNGRSARIGGGLEAGARLVVAGVNSLSEGQVVKIQADKTDERTTR